MISDSIAAIALKVGLFALFLVCGFLIFVAPQLLQREIGVLYQICLTVVFFISVTWLRSNERLHKYFQVFFAFFVASFALFLQYIVEVVGLSSSTIAGVVFSKLLSTLLVEEIIY